MTLENGHFDRVSALIRNKERHIGIDPVGGHDSRILHLGIRECQFSFSQFRRQGMEGQILIQ